MIISIRLLIIPVLIIFSALMPVYAIEQIDPTAGLKIYSRINYIKDEGEYYGLQIVVIPYYQGQKILWRSGNGRLDPPLLLDIKQNGKEMRVLVPEGDDNHGEWILSLKSKRLIARGPRNLNFSLKEVTSK